jgi:hypothetical protein
MTNQACLQNAQRELISPDQLRSRDINGFENSRSLDKRYPFLKAHMKDGSLYTFSEWSVEEKAQSVTGTAIYYDSYRVEQGQGIFTVPIDSVAIFETNKTRPSAAIAAMTLITGISLAITAYCISNPKACFGSCPTIYDTSGVLQAEGFSASIAPSLEADDIDFLRVSYPENGRFSLHVKNEALETHVIRSMNLLLVPKSNNSTVFLGVDGEFYEASALTQPASLQSLQPFDKSLIDSLDLKEYCSRADSSDLATKDILELSFERPKGDRLGLVIGCRQSLLSTYLLYSGLGYLGSQAGHWLAQLERGGSAVRSKIGGIGRQLGGIDVMVQQENGAWSSAGCANETGPLAVDVHLVPLSAQYTEDSLYVRLQMAKGHWRLDYVALASINECGEALELTPSRVAYNNLADPQSRDKLLDTSQVLITFPGDAYEIEYELPEVNRSYQLFVKSRGYYLEWMRDEWVREENLGLAAEVFLAPDEALKRMAPDFKEVEDEMEDFFWNSKYAH